MEKLDFFMSKNTDYTNKLKLKEDKVKKKKVKLNNDKITIKFLQENSDFCDYKLDKDFLSRFLKELNNIEAKIPKENIRKLNELINDKNKEPRIIIEKIFQTKFNDHITKILISNFENELLGPSRQNNRLIIFYKIDKNKFTIIHTTKKNHLCSESEEFFNTLIIKESFWDFKDYLRIVIFQLKDSDITVKVKEYSESSFFDRWLNFKKIRKSYNRDLLIELDIGNSITLNYPPGFNELYNGLTKGSIKIKGKNLIFENIFDESKKIYNIKSIEYDNRIYQGEHEYKLFITKFKTDQKYPNLVNLNDKFINFLKRKKYELLSWNQETPCKKLKLLENYGKIYHPNKEDITFKKGEFEDFDLILCSGMYTNYIIYPDDELITKIQNYLLNFKETFKIIKLGKEFSIQKPFRINNLIIFNKLQINKTYFKIVKKLTDLANERDKNVKKIISFLKYILLHKFLIDKDFKFLLEYILKDLFISIDSKHFYDKENEILEFKDKRFYENKGKDEIERNFLDIAKKYSHNRFKFVIIGMNEKNEIDAINENYIHSDWIGYFENQLNVFLKPHNKKAFTQQIPVISKSKVTYLIIFIIY